MSNSINALASSGSVRLAMSAVALPFDYDLPCDLPVELWIYILQFVGLAFFPVVARVSRVFYVLSMDPVLLRKCAPGALNGYHLYHLAMWPEFEAWWKTIDATVLTTRERCTALQSELALCGKEKSCTVGSLKRAKKPSTIGRLKKVLLENTRTEAFLTERLGASRARYKIAERAKRNLRDLWFDIPKRWIYNREHCPLPSREHESVGSKINTCIYAVMTGDAETAVRVAVGWLYTERYAQFAVAFAASDDTELIRKLLWQKGSIRYAFKRELVQKSSRFSCPNLVIMLFQEFDFVAAGTFAIAGTKWLLAHEVEKYSRIRPSVVDALWTRGKLSKIAWAGRKYPEIARALKPFPSRHWDTLFALERSSFKHEVVVETLLVQRAYTDAHFSRIMSVMLVQAVEDGYVTSVDLVRKNPRCADLLGDTATDEAVMIAVKHDISSSCLDSVRAALTRAEACGFDLPRLVLACKRNPDLLVPVVHMFSKERRSSLMTVALTNTRTDLVQALFDTGYSPTDDDLMAVAAMEYGRDEMQTVFDAAASRVLFK